MHYIKLETSDQDVRWINLEQVSRVTVGQEASGVPFAAVVFSDGNLEECLKIHGTEDVDRRAINKLTAVLDHVSEGE
jgi:hypothetical protein